MLTYRTYALAEAEANHRALQGECCAVWQDGDGFTVWFCGQDNPGVIRCMIIPSDD